MVDAMDDEAMIGDLMRQHPLFEGLPLGDFERLQGQARETTVRAGQRIIEEGAPGDVLYVLLDGELEVLRRSGSGEVMLATHHAGAIVGEMALLSDAPRSASVRASQDSRLLEIDGEAFRDLLSCSPTAAVTILRTVMTRLRSTENLLVQHQKMAALGTLAAGVAHELNNPASAVKRGVAQLEEAVQECQGRTLELSRLSFGAEQAAVIDTLRDEIMRSKPADFMESLSMLEISDLESRVQDWMEDHSVDRSWEYAPTLVSAGWDQDRLDQLTGTFSDEDLAVLIPWIASTIGTVVLLREIGLGAGQLSEIVGAIKTYAYLDRAPIQNVQVQEGLETTLVILRHKLRGVQVHREYARDVPSIEAYAGELNQVWTNLIDNAIDAMDGQGELTIRTYREDDVVVVEISDTGPGIPPEIQQRVFEPFFTTKAPGSGSGLGLHIVYNVVVEKHHGRIDVTSNSAGTSFKVSLPLRLSSEQP